MEPLQAIRYCTDFAESDYAGLASRYWLIRRQIKNFIVLVRVLVREQGMPLSLDIWTFSRHCHHCGKAVTAIREQPTDGTY